MKAIVIHKHGNLKEVCSATMPAPTWQKNQLLVDITYAGLNHLDLFVTQGWPGLRLNFPHILGSDGCGQIAEIGPACETAFKVGEAVVIDPTLGWRETAPEFAAIKPVTLIGEHIHGTFAQQIAVNPENIHPLPKHLTMEQGAAFPLTFVTAWRMLTSRAKAQPGETILIQGIGGGVAMAALQLAHAMGLHVFGNQPSPRKTRDR